MLLTYRYRVIKSVIRACGSIDGYLFVSFTIEKVDVLVLLCADQYMDCSGEEEVLMLDDYC